MLLLAASVILDAMALPNETLFEEFFSGTRVVDEKPEGKSIQIFDPDTSAAPSVPGLWLVYPELELKLQSVLRVIGRELEARGSNGDFDTALAELALIAETCPDGSAPVEHANNMLERTREARLCQAVLFPNRVANDYEVEFATTRMGVFKPEYLLNAASRAMVGYPVDLASLAGRYCIERSGIQVLISDWGHHDCYMQLAQKWTPNVTEVLIDNYFQAVNNYYLSQIPNALSRELCVLEAGSLVALDESLFKHTFFQSKLALFTWEDERPRGWALLGHQNILHMNFPPKELIDDCREWLRTEFDFDEFSESKPFDQATKSYCRFVQKGQTYRLSGARDDAFLHFMIALDLLLGEEGRSSDSVCTRAAVLSYSQLGLPLNDHTSSIKRLYRKRSKYVHEGQSVNEGDLGDVEAICLEVLWVLLAALKVEGLERVEDWLNGIDYLSAAVLASKEPRDEDFCAVGILRRADKRVPPNHLNPNAVGKRLFTGSLG